MSNKLDKILAEISAGELIDKITILEIKKIKISDKNKLNEIEKELLSLNDIFKQFIPDSSSTFIFRHCCIYVSSYSEINNVDFLSPYTGEKEATKTLSIYIP